MRETEREGGRENFEMLLNLLSSQSSFSREEESIMNVD